MLAQTTPTATTNLFLLEDLEDVGRTSELAQLYLSPRTVE
jgi:hypothetical protein